MTRLPKHSRLVAGLLAIATLPATVLPAAAQYRDDDRGYDRRYDDRYEDDRGGYRYDSEDYAYEEDDRDAPDVTYFYDELEGDGRWISHPVYGEVFRPYGLERDWRPYSRGHWVYTDEYGWYWVSEERFGWATYHYGRWHLDQRYGWVWVPGTRWAPAWVAWRSSDDYVGWAPLPPDTYWEPRRGLIYDEALYSSPRFSMYWSFVEPRYVTQPGLYRYYAPQSSYGRIMYRTRPRTDYVYVDRRIVNRGVPIRDYERVTRSRVDRYRVEQGNRRDWRGPSRVEGRNVRAYRPDLTRSRVEEVRRERGKLPPQVGPGTTFGNVDRRPAAGNRAKPDPKRQRVEPRRDDRPAARSVARPRPGDDTPPPAIRSRPTPPAAGAGSTFAPGRAAPSPKAYEGNRNAPNRARQNAGGGGRPDGDDGPPRKKPAKRQQKPADQKAQGNAKPLPSQVGPGTSFGGATR